MPSAGFTGMVSLLATTHTHNIVVPVLSGTGLAAEPRCGSGQWGWRVTEGSGRLVGTRKDVRVESSPETRLDRCLSSQDLGGRDRLREFKVILSNNVSSRPAWAK